MKKLLKCTLLLAMISAGAAARAEWPERPIRIVVPFPAGGVDVMVRMISDDLAKRLGQPVLVENRDGAGGNIGMTYASTAAPDGYTLVMASSGNFVINQHIYRSFRVDPLKAFTPVIHVADIPGILFSSASMPANDFRSMVAYAKANKGKVNFGSPGVATTPHLALENISRTLGLDLTHIPFRGTPPLLTAMVTGDVQLGFGLVGTFLPQVERGKLRVLAVSGDKRLGMLPDTPTFRELGLQHVGGETWWAIAAPAGTPEPVLERLNAAMRQAWSAPEVRKKLEDMGIIVVASTRPQMVEKMAREAPRWARTIKELGIPMVD